MAKPREQELRREFLGQTARIRWHELQTYYARGRVVSVAADLNLVEVAVHMGTDNSDQFTRWIDQGRVAPVTDEQALAWYQADAEVWAVVAAPWVLVQSQQKP